MNNAGNTIYAWSSLPKKKGLETNIKLYLYVSLFLQRTAKVLIKTKTKGIFVFIGVQ